jgi:hypothetical protein
VPLGAGDAVVHQYDLEHGVKVRAEQFPCLVPDPLFGRAVGAAAGVGERAFESGAVYLTEHVVGRHGAAVTQVRGGGTRHSWIVWLQDGGRCASGGKQSWHLEAAERGDPVAAFNVGNVLASGLDPAQGHPWCVQPPLTCARSARWGRQSHPVSTEGLCAASASAIIIHSLLPPVDHGREQVREGGRGRLHGGDVLGGGDARAGAAGVRRPLCPFWRPF